MQLILVTYDIHIEKHTDQKKYTYDSFLQIEHIYVTSIQIKK